MGSKGGKNIIGNIMGNIMGNTIGNTIGNIMGRTAVIILAHEASAKDSGRITLRFRRS